MNDRFCKDADLLLSGLTWKREDAQRVLSAAKGEYKPMKKKLSVSFALIISLVFITTAVAFAIGLTKSQQYTTVSAAREALMERYDLTQDMIALFDTETEEANGVTTITFTTSGSSFIDPDAVGQYTAVADAQGDITVSWSHDDADPASWADGDLAASVWGAPQLEQSLARHTLYTQWWEDHDRSYVYSLPTEEREALFDELRAAVAPLELVDIPREESTQAIEPLATPVVNLTDDDASRIAAQALYNRYGLTEEMLTLFTPVQTLDVINGIPVRTITYLPASIENPLDGTDWRWADVLEEKLGTYIVTVDAQDSSVGTVEWSLEDTAGDAAYTAADWADADAYSADVISYVLALLNQNESIIVKYPDGQRDWFSLEDAAAYDQAFRDAGFDAATYNHSLPRDTDLTQEQATELARAAMADAYALSDEELDEFTLTMEYVLDNGGSWWIGFYGNDGMGSVKLNAATSEIQMVNLMSSAAVND